MSTRSEDDRAQGRSILETWEDLWHEEPELGIRLMQLLLYGLTHLRDKDRGRALEGRLRRVLIDRVSFDAAAKDALYTLDRCAGSLYQPDVAVVRNQEAVDHFGAASDDVVRRPVEYYRCLVNLGATLICNARYAEAIEVYADAERLIDRYPADVFPRVDYPRMNVLLAEYRLGVTPTADAVERQASIVASSKLAGDPFYVENALAVYLALAGEHAEAMAIFDRLDLELMSSRFDPEPSMQYLIRANRAATRFLIGEGPAARAEWDGLSDLLDRIAYVTRPFLVRRHELLGRVLAGPPLPPTQFDECLVARRPPEFGPLWDNYGRGFRMPEVEFWREN